MKEKILRATARLISRKGAKAASTRAICAELGSPRQRFTITSQTKRLCSTRLWLWPSMITFEIGMPAPELDEPEEDLRQA